MIRRDNDNCHHRAARGLRVIIQMGLLTSRWSRGHEYSDVSDANYGTNERRGPGAGGRGLVIMIMVRARVTHLISPPANFHSLAAFYTDSGPF